MKKNLLAILLGVFFSLSAFAFLEIVFRLNEYTHWLKPVGLPMYIGASNIELEEAASREIFEKLKGDPVYQWQPLIPYADADKFREEGKDESKKGPLNCCIGRRKFHHDESFESQVYSKLTKKLIYQAHYTLDELGRRATPKRPHPKYNIVFMGDSYSMGEGVSDEQSAPYQLGLRRPDAQVYNLSVTGGSPNEVLYELSEERPERLQDLRPIKTIVIYTYMDHHPERLFCRSLCLRKENLWMQTKPYYNRENGQVTFQGFFDRDRRALNWVYGLMNESAFINFFPLVWPPYFTRAHFEFFADVLLKAQEQVHRLFKDSDFYVAFYPGSASRVFGPKVSAASQQRELHTLDYYKLDEETFTDHKKVLSVDRHPSPVAQFVFGYLLDRDLPKAE